MKQNFSASTGELSAVRVTVAGQPVQQVALHEEAAGGYAAALRAEDSSSLPTEVEPKSRFIVQATKGSLWHNVEAINRLKLLREHLPQHSLCEFEDAIAGRDAYGCTIAAPNELRGYIAVLFYLRFRTGQCSLEDYQTILQSTWCHDHAYVRQAANGRQRLKAMFRTGRFPIPDALPEMVQIWRGVFRNDAISRKGISWTIHRPVACWFAMRYADHKGAEPVVLTMKIPRSSLLYWDNEREEQEVICFDTTKINVDGNKDEWTRDFHAICMERKAEV